ncbi:MAG: hypothetical protein F4Z31_07290 [Gemmatimonadetes bacterium]|nr:DUF6361 family protein [Gemmatimonadota bacterium]MYA41539.1 hypothetical protein [Gemmatimonadota bacterium]MYF07794.1 hypothetical protein [Rhodospirillaceae bacterium]
MTSTLTWLDYSERDRRRALEVIDRFKETETIDELGLAGVGNSYSDLFFPGTTTLQTRACYFLLIPWAFLKLEQSSVASSEAARKARTAELRINRRLRKGTDTWGIFGSQAGDALKRLPSEVYWGGLGAWGIRTFSGHKRAYFRSLDGFRRRKEQFRNTRRDPEGRSAPPMNWHPHLPKPPSGFPSAGVSVALRRRDAEYLRERIQTRQSESLLAVLAGRAVAKDLDADWPWDLANLPEVPPLLRNHLLDAKRFAVCMQGAALLYNLMLSELRKREEWQERYRRRLANWADEVLELESALEDWKLDRVWRVVRTQGWSLRYPTRSFVQSWVKNLKRAGPECIADNDNARTLVRDRETQLKRARARLTNPRRLELWGGESGTGRLSYRWGPARRVLKDIFDGLARSEGDAGNA